MYQDKVNLETNRSSQWIEQVYLEHGKFIESVIRFAAKDSKEGDDIYQEIFLSLLALKNPSNISDIRNYLYILTINKVKEFRRKKNRSKQVLDGYTNYVSATKEPYDQDTTLAFDETGKMLEVISTYLSKKEAEAVLLRYQHQEENEHAAKIMNVNKNTFLRYVSVGMKKIRTVIQDKKLDE